MPESEEKKFDVSRPQETAPSASGRPLIVGHRPTIADPMLRSMARPTPPNPAPAPVIGGTPSNFNPQPTVMSNQPVDNFARPPIAGQPPSAPISTPQLPIKDNNGGGGGTTLRWLILIILAVLIGAYLAIDSGLINAGINLPFHIFKQDKSNNSSAQPTTSTTPPVASTASIPAGFDQYKDSAVPFVFDYPTAWGLPTAVTEPGFSKRGGTNKSDGTYAVTLSFATNKDIQIIATSGKFLPAARTSLYYDFGQWCIGSSDNKIYKSALHFTTAAGVDTATTMVCDQGPLTDATKVTTAIIVQPNVKDSTGKSVGDIYTANLDSAQYPVLRLKDATMANATNIKILLGTIH